ncbi:Bifunctional aspartokinase/homoserine dehydrogenase 2, chloroplastic [Linum perenne]
MELSFSLSALSAVLQDESSERVLQHKSNSWSVHKFGGTCVGSSERIKNVAEIIANDSSEGKFVVVSAMSKVTDMMHDLINRAQSRDDSFITAADAVFEKHRLTATELLEGDDLATFLSRLHHDITNLKAMLRAIFIAGHATESFEDFVVGHGELWSAQLLSYVVKKVQDLSACFKGLDCKWMDTRDVLIVNNTSSNQVDPDFVESERRLEEWFTQNPSKAVVATGFIASTPQNIPTTLKRDGSDFSAAIMGALLRAAQVTIWTDVDGIYSADPRKVSEAVILKTLSYQEAWEMASSEHSACFAVSEKEVKYVADALKSRFREALDAGRLSQVAVVPNCSILTVVGRKMASTPGVIATLFNALAKANINVRAVAQGCSEYNVTVVIKREDCVRALRAAHSTFYLSKTTISVGIIGPGLIGATLLDQLRDQQFSKRTSTSNCVGIDLARWREHMKGNGEVADLEKFTHHVQGNHFIPNTVLVDCTADAAIASHYYDWLRKGIHVVTPNKKANSGPLDQYLKLRALQRKSYTHFFYEATVGAGLPIISTLRGLLETGDKILQVEGIFSGTLSYIFNNFVGDRAFSDVVSEAKEKCYTEPDPRDDLSGTDVARKVIILARESGLKLELSDIPIQSLVPDPLRASASADEFMKQLPQFDQDIAKERRAAEGEGEVLRYVGVVDVIHAEGRVELRRYKKDHAFAQLSGSDNIIAFTTSRYKDQPLIVRGPGAGAQVTAGGVFSDILRLASYLGAPS